MRCSTRRTDPRGGTPLLIQKFVLNPSHCCKPASTIAICSLESTPKRRTKNEGGIETRPWTKKAPDSRKRTGRATSKREPRIAVVCGTTAMSARSESSYGTLITRAGRTFWVIPKSTCQTSPRLATARSRFLRVQDAECLRRYSCEVILSQVLCHWNARGKDAPQFGALWKRETFNFLYDMRQGSRHETKIPLVALRDKRAKLTPQKPAFFMSGWPWMKWRSMRRKWRGHLAEAGLERSRHKGRSSSVRCRRNRAMPRRTGGCSDRPQVIPAGLDSL